MINGRARRIGGHAIWFNGDIGVPNIEKDSCTCCHCSKVVFVDPLKPVEDFTGWCMRCMKFTCLECAKSGECVPFERRLDLMEGRRR